MKKNGIVKEVDINEESLRVKQKYKKVKKLCDHVIIDKLRPTIDPDFIEYLRSFRDDDD